MSQQCNSPKSFVAGEALNAFTRVKLSGATVVYADAGDSAIGVTQEACSSGDNVPLRLIPHPGSYKVLMGTSCSAGDSLYAANNGVLSTVANGNVKATALEDASGSGSIIEVLQVA